jgi:hypothetical protein
VIMAGGAALTTPLDREASPRLHGSSVTRSTDAVGQQKHLGRKPSCFPRFELLTGRCRATDFNGLHRGLMFRDATQGASGLFPKPRSQTPCCLDSRSFVPKPPRQARTSLRTLLMLIIKARTYPEKKLLTTAAARFGAPFSWNRP